MGTKVHCKSYLPGYYYSMRDLNEDSSSSSWPLHYGDKTTTTNGHQYYNGFLPKTINTDGYPGHGKDALKQKMLEHEAVFKNQVCELHRLYRIQRDMMEEVKRKERNEIRASMEPSTSSSLRGSQVPQDARKWQIGGISLLNSAYDRTYTSGVEIVNSPMSCTKGNNNIQPDHFPFKNGSSLKESEPLDSRPLKARKKLFDLQLPADEYIDTEEDEKVPENRASQPSPVTGGHETRKLSLGGHAAGVKNSVRLADLNEPIHIEETSAPSSIDFFGHSSINGETRGVNQPTKPNAGYLGVNGSLINSSEESKVNERGHLSRLYEPGSSKSNLSAVTHGFHRDKLPITSHPTVRIWEEPWRESNNNNLDPFVASRVPGSDPFFTSSRFATSWAQSISSWAKPTSSNFSQKINSCLNPVLGGKLVTPNGFYHGSASGSKDPQVHLPSGSGSDYRNCSRGDNAASSDRSTSHGLGCFPKLSCRADDAKPAIDLNLNEVVPKSSSNDAVILQDGKGNSEDHLSALPWLKRKPIYASERVTDLNEPFTPKVMLASSDCEMVRENEIAETQSVKKILGFPIFASALQNVPSSCLSAVGCTLEGNNVKKERKNIIIDINVELFETDEQVAAEEPTVEMKKQAKSASIRDFIDLNSCASDSEDPSAPSYERQTARVLDIDLEAPVLMENDENMAGDLSSQSLENKNESLYDELLTTAAEAILAISSSSSCPKIHPSEASLAESLLWFADVVSSSRANDVMDDFEVMTLQLQETREEDYMPKPFVPEVERVEDEGANSNFPTRSRRGQSRRGRQRRDFQRDILPGLASLSRHEVTEDIQTFSGLMRATGHHWVSGLTRRNGSGRGRKRVVVETVVEIPVCNIEGGSGSLEDGSFTGWGKTTRRPRRQRCASGNLSAAAVVLT